MAGAGQQGEQSLSSSWSTSAAATTATAQPPGPSLTSTSDPVLATNTAGSPPRPPPFTSSTQPTLQLRRTSSGANKHNVTGARLPRRLTAQERLDGILE
ncbi:hypothetical protein M406DRAFT_107126, partial [Cryphonectria parasitica EP155]